MRNNRVCEDFCQRAYEINHDLYQPLARILGLVDLILIEYERGDMELVRKYRKMLDPENEDLRRRVNKLFVIEKPITMKAILTRLQYQQQQTLGVLQLFDRLEKVYECKTLELPWQNNARNVSCIPEGRYDVIIREVPHRGRHFHVLNVPDRSLILIHVGNYYTDIQGCILPGQDYFDINHDGLLDVSSSRLALEGLLSQAPQGFKLTITS